MKVKLIRDHSPTCVYVAHPHLNRHSPWYLDTWEGVKHEKLDAAGGRRGDGYRWITAICADSTCEARAIVRIDTLEEAIWEALKRA